MLTAQLSLPDYRANSPMIVVLNPNAYHIYNTADTATTVVGVVCFFFSLSLVAFFF